MNLEEVKKYFDEIDWVLNEFDEILEDRVKQELLRYKDRKLSEE